MEPKPALTYAFGRFEFSPDQLLLTCGGEIVPIGTRALKLLLALVQRRGETIHREELMQLVWPGRAVHDGNMRVQIGALRKALSDGVGGLALIKTFPMQGYAFLAPVTHRIVERLVTDEPMPVSEARVPSGNLPASPTPFPGGGQAIEEISAALVEHRLVSIVGAGGIGKTAVGLAVARRNLKLAVDGVYFLELSAVSDAGAVISTLMTALGVAENCGSPLSSLIAQLRDKTMLLLIDTCEHIIDELAQLTETLLSSCPKLRIIATSREPLWAVGEWLHRLQPLPLPKACELPALNKTVFYASVDLFAHRLSVGRDGSLQLPDERDRQALEILLHKLAAKSYYPSTCSDDGRMRARPHFYINLPVTLRPSDFL